jgi:pentatricopeptide repeat protein
MKKCQDEGNDVTWNAAFNACGKTVDLEKGWKLHENVRQSNNVIVLTSLLDMYCKCGDLDAAIQLWDDMSITQL